MTGWHHHHQGTFIPMSTCILVWHSTTTTSPPPPPPPCSPPLPPTSPSDLLVVFSDFPPTMRPTFATNKSQWLVGGLFWLSTHHMAHLHYQWVPVTCWWSFLAHHPPCGPTPPSMSHIDSLVVYYVTKRALAMRTGPDDAGHIAWAIGKSFSFYFVFF